MRNRIIDDVLIEQIPDETGLNIASQQLAVPEIRLAVLAPTGLGHFPDGNRAAAVQGVDIDRTGRHRYEYRQASTPDKAYIPAYSAYSGGFCEIRMFLTAAEVSTI